MADLGCCVCYHIKWSLKHVRFMPFLSFPPSPLKPVGSTDHSQPDLGEIQRWTYLQANNWVAERERMGRHEMSFPSFYCLLFTLKLFHMKGVLLSSFGTMNVCQYAEMHNKRWWDCSSELSHLDQGYVSNKTPYLFPPTFHFGIAWEKSTPSSRASLVVLHLRLILLCSGFLWLRGSTGMPWRAAHLEQSTNIWERRSCPGSAWQ